MKSGTNINAFNVKDSACGQYGFFHQSVFDHVIDFLISQTGM